MAVFRGPRQPEIHQLMYLSPYNKGIVMEYPESPLHAYVEAARRRISQLQGPGETSWREVVDRGFGEALSQGDLSGFTRVVQLVAHLLESEGRFEAILSEIDSALSLTLKHPGPTASLLALKASVLPTFGRIEDARRTAEEAANLAASHLSGESRLKALALVESTRLVILDPPSPTLPKLLAELTAEARELDHLFLLSWMVPYMVAQGDVAGAGPLVRRTRAMARAQDAGLRVADAAVFERWQNVVSGTELAMDGRVDRRAHIPAWRDAWLDLWVAILRREWKAAEVATETLQRRAKRLGQHTGDPAHADALLQAAAIGARPGNLNPTPIQSLTLDNLPSNMAAGYAVALAGDSSEARRWLEWTTRLRRRGIMTTLEVPVSVARVQGLLALRAGKPAAARRYLDQAERESAAGFRLEAAIAGAQATELRNKAGVADASADDAPTTERPGDFGIDPVPHQYVVHLAWDAGKAPRSRPLLTPREVDILRELERGRTYKEAAADLGIAWRTVQTLAHRIYEKLGVSKRMEAIVAARRQGLL
ncbi:MAG: LuxR C-terminal-related transcriptional regulator [Dehalococcoidia bacterium]